jgi:hypothetical protein
LCLILLDRDGARAKAARAAVEDGVEVVVVAVVVAVEEEEIRHGNALFIDGLDLSTGGYDEPFCS